MLLFALAGCAPEGVSRLDANEGAKSAEQAALEGTPWNFVLVLTDDQRFDSLWAMPILGQRLVDTGVNFVNGYVSTPLCCPDRGSLLSGGFLAQNTGVLATVPPNGGFAGFEDTNALAPHLAAGGYRTGFVGKYINGYDYAGSYAPPGWDLFAAKETFDQETVVWPVAQTFLQDHQAEPFFLMIAPSNPHPPSTPRPEDADLFPDYVYRERGFTETSFTDKPLWALPLRSDHGVDAPDAAAEDELHRDQLRSLQTVDRMMGSLFDELDTLGLSDHTIVFFTSDNGYLWGEHQLFAKRWAYEESVRVPLIVGMPGVAPREEQALAVTNLDIPATIYDLAGVEGPTQGQSLAPLILDAAAPWRDRFLIEHFGSNFPSQQYEIYAGVRTRDADGEWKYVEYAGGEKELYDLVNDPYELDSKHANPTQASRVAAFAAELAEQKGVAITTAPRKVKATVGVDLSHQLTAWGGNGEYTWSVTESALPAGLGLDAASGLVSGVPEVAGTFVASVQLEDTKLATYLNRPQRFVTQLTIEVAPGAGGTGGTGGIGGSDNGGAGGVESGGAGGIDSAGGGAGVESGGSDEGGATALAGGGGTNDSVAGAGGSEPGSGPAQAGASGAGPIATGTAGAGGDDSVTALQGGGGSKGQSDDGGRSSEPPTTASAGESDQLAASKETESDAGCGCRSARAPHRSYAAWPALLALAALVRRKSRPPVSRRLRSRSPR